MLSVSSPSLSRCSPSPWPSRSPSPSWSPLKSECKPSLSRVWLRCSASTTSNGSSRDEGKNDSGSDRESEKEKETEKEREIISLGDGLDLEAEVTRMLEDMESQSLMQDLNAAVERVAKAKKELDALEELKRLAEMKESNEAADTMVENFQRDVFAAEIAMRDAEIALIKARAGDSIWGLTWEKQDGIDEDAERIESAKVASVSAVIGTIAGLPFFAATSLEGLQLAVSAGIVFASCALFGLTYRYAIRRDLSNTQLKAGCVAAFSLVRGLGQIDASGVLLGFPEIEKLDFLKGGLLTAESISVFGFAAVALEYCFRQGLLRPFPLREQ